MSTALYTAAPLAMAVVILGALRLLMMKSVANLCVAGFLACVIPSPLMLVAHADVAIAMGAIGLACVVPAYLLADERADDDGDDREPEDPDPGPDPGPWSEFERDFWSYVEKTRELVHV